MSDRRNYQVSSAQESNYAYQSDIVHTHPSEQQFVIDASNTLQEHQPNSSLLQPLFYTMLPLATTTPPSNNTLTDLQPQRVRHCKTCHRSICPGKTGRRKCPLLIISIKNLTIIIYPNIYKSIIFFTYINSNKKSIKKRGLDPFFFI